MREEYAQALKVLGEYMKLGAEFPPEGLGPGNTPGDKAVRAIKIMATQMIRLAVLDEAAAIDGTRPLEQIADSSGIAWGGTCLQMTRDLSGFNVLMTASKGLTPAQQSWPPLTLEGYAQLETKRAQKKNLGSMKSLCWTDHANWTRQLVLEDIDVKHLRWVSWIVADGSQIRSLSGRSAKLGDGFSRNPSDRDALIEQRTKDLEGRTGQLRGFSLEAFLSDYEEGEKVFPWTIAGDAIPDKPEGQEDSDCGERAVSAGVPPVSCVEGADPERNMTSQEMAGLMAAAGVKPELRVVYVADYDRMALLAVRHEFWRQAVRHALPEYHTIVSMVRGPFEDDDGNRAHIEAKLGHRAKQKLLLETKKDLLTAVVTLARQIAHLRADVAVGEGQGGLVLAAYSRPLVLEVALQARNVQRQEAQSIAQTKVEPQRRRC